MNRSLDYSAQIKNAVSTYWKTIEEQGGTQGGRHMDGFTSLVAKVLDESQMPGARICTRSKLELPGRYRPTKQWDMLIVRNNCLIAAIELKSMSSSFAKNFNNRVEEALGSATDLWAAYGKGLLGPSQPRPWLGWAMLLVDCDESQESPAVREPHFPVDPEFAETSHADRFGVLARRLVADNLYSRTALLLSTEKEGRLGKYTEPVHGFGMADFVNSLAIHIRTYAAAIEA